MKGHQGTYKVIQVEDVPKYLIKYDPVTQEGGVEHHQWLIIDFAGKPQTFSGAWFDPDSEFYRHMGKVASGETP